MHVNRYEKFWIILSSLLLVVFAAAVATSSVAYGIQVPAPEQRVDPRVVATPGNSPFGEPGLRELAPGKYEAYILAQAWSYSPKEIRVAVGSTVTFYLTSRDVQHGFKLEGTNINMMVLPGQVSKLTTTFDKPGTYPFICHEYCGVGHQSMFGQLIVEG